MIRPRGWHVVLFLFVFVLVLGILAPAVLVTAYLEEFSAGKLAFANTQGTVWRGSGILLLRDGTQFLPLGRYTWRIAPARDMSHVSVTVENGAEVPSQLQVWPWRNEIAVQSAYAVLPAQLLAVFAPQLTPYRLSGELRLASESFHISPNSNEGTIILDWKQATSGLTDIAPLGDYRIVLRGEGTQLKVALSTVAGKLKLTGSGQIESGRPLTFSGTAQAAPEQKENLSELLHHIGPESSPGIFSFALLQQ